MPSSSFNSSSQSPVATPQGPLHPPRPFFLESSGASDPESTATRPPSQPRGSTPGHIRTQDRQGSPNSIVPSGATTPANPFSTPVMETTNLNALTPPASVISFSLGDVAATGFGNAHQRISAQSSLASSAIDLQQRPHSAAPREAFSSPRPRPMTYTSVNQGTRSRLAKRKLVASTMLSGEITKPWVGKKDKAARISYFLTYSMLLLGIAAAGLRCYFGWRSVSMISPGHLCPVLDDDFNGNDLDPSVWMREIDLGGFGSVSSPTIFFSSFPFFLLCALTRIAQEW